jgi:thioredoxin-like negative regulator of GroEL
MIYSQDVANKLGIRGLPTFVLYKNGKRIDHFTSADKDTIQQNIMDNI